MKKDYLLGEINEKIKKYDLQLEDFLKRLKMKKIQKEKIYLSRKKNFLVT